MKEDRIMMCINIAIHIGSYTTDEMPNKISPFVSHVCIFTCHSSVAGPRDDVSHLKLALFSHSWEQTWLVSHH